MSKWSSKVSGSFHVPASNIWEFQYLHILATLIIVFFIYSRTSQFAVVAYCAFDLNFDVLICIMIFLLAFFISSWSNVYSDYLPILTEFSFLIIESYDFLYIQNTSSLLDIWFENIFFCSMSCVFTVSIASFVVQGS